MSTIVIHAAPTWWLLIDIYDVFNVSKLTSEITAVIKARH